MPLIAYTKTGNNCLVAGLISHAAALFVGMMMVAGAEAFFQITYILAWVLLVSGSFAELRHRGVRPFKARRFYLTALAAVVPVLGPLVVLGLIYNCSEDGRAGQADLPGFFRSLWRLRTNALMVFALLVLLLLLFVFLSSREDPYFQKHRRIETGSISGQMEPFIKMAGNSAGCREEILSSTLWDEKSC